MHPYSLTTAKIEMLFDSPSLETPTVGGIGTSFFYRLQEKPFLITNWHNVTGLHAETLEPLHKKGLMLPNKIRVHYKIKVSEMTITSAPIILPLYREEKPLWREHTGRNKIDVVALPIDLSLFPDFVNTFINEMEEEIINVIPGTDCFILGFPEGIIGPANTPIWKGGTVAREPYPSVPNLVDSATREGMSGSPVILRHTGIFGVGSDPFLTGHEKIGTGYKFMGVYSSRVGDDQLGYQLGNVWQPELIEEIISNGQSGVHPSSPSGIEYQ